MFYISARGQVERIAKLADVQSPCQLVARPSDLVDFDVGRATAQHVQLVVEIRDAEDRLSFGQRRLQRHLNPLHSRRLRAHTQTRSSAIADGPRDASCQLKSRQLPRNSVETTCMTSPVNQVSTVANWPVQQNRAVDSA